MYHFFWLGKRWTRRRISSLWRNYWVSRETNDKGYPLKFSRESNDASAKKNGWILTEIYQITNFFPRKKKKNFFSKEKKFFFSFSRNKLKRAHLEAFLVISNSFCNHETKKKDICIFGDIIYLRPQREKRYTISLFFCPPKKRDIVYLFS